MIIQITKYLNIFYALIILIILFTFLLLIRAFFIRNKKQKKLLITTNSSCNYHRDRLFELISIDTPTFVESDGYYKFKEKIEEQFPLIHTLLQKEKLDGNAIYSYQSTIDNAPSILFASHIDYAGNHMEAYLKERFIYGNGTFDSKSLLYVIFEAVESILKEKGKLDVNLTIVITNDDEAKKDGLSKIINLFLKRGDFFNLVIEEGSGIIDPEIYGLKSNYALVGLGVSGQLQLRFESNSKEHLLKFISEVNKPNFFKMKIDNKSIKVLSNISKDMNFKDRFFLNNMFVFKRKAKTIIESKYSQIEKMLKTNVFNNSIEERDNKYHTELVFELSTHEKAADILMHLDDTMEKYKIDYKIINVIESSRITRTYTYGYNFIKTAINNVFKEVYIAPVIVTKISEKRYFDKVSDCVIRFSPLYYDLEAFGSSNTDNSYIDSASLENGIEFFKYIINNYNKKGE